MEVNQGSNNGFLPQQPGGIGEEMVLSIASHGSTTFVLGDSQSIFYNASSGTDDLQPYPIEGLDKPIEKIHAGGDHGNPYLLLQHDDASFTLVQDGKIVKESIKLEKNGETVETTVDAVHVGGTFAIVQGGSDLYCVGTSVVSNVWSVGRASCSSSNASFLYRSTAFSEESSMKNGTISLTQGWYGMQASVGHDHCAILAGKISDDDSNQSLRRVYTFGSDSHGQLGRTKSRSYIQAFDKFLRIVDAVAFGNRTYVISDDGALYGMGDIPVLNTMAKGKVRVVNLGHGNHGAVKFHEIAVGTDFLVGVQKTEGCNDLLFKLDGSTHSLESVELQGLVAVHEVKVCGPACVVKAIVKKTKA